MTALLLLGILIAIFLLFYLAIIGIFFKYKTYLNLFVEKK